MKLSKILTPQKLIQYKIDKRNAQKLSRVKIENLTNKNEEKFIMDNINPLASFANKNKLHLTFTNGEGLFANQTELKIYKTKYHFMGKELPVMFKYLDHVGSIFPNLFAKEGNSREIIESLKSCVKNFAKTK